MPDDTEAAVRRFLATLFALREQLGDEDFAALRGWLEFLAAESSTAH